MSKPTSQPCSKCMGSGRILIQVAESVVQVSLCDCRSGEMLDHFIPRSSLPALPEGWKPPFKFVDAGEMHFLQDGHTSLVMNVNCPERTRTFLAALLNAVYGGSTDDTTRDTLAP